MGLNTEQLGMAEWKDFFKQADVFILISINHYSGQNKSTWIYLKEVIHWPALSNNFYHDFMDIHGYMIVI